LTDKNLLTKAPNTRVG